MGIDRIQHTMEISTDDMDRPMEQPLVAKYRLDPSSPQFTVHMMPYPFPQRGRKGYLAIHLMDLFINGQFAQVIDNGKQAVAIGGIIEFFHHSVGLFKSPSCNVAEVRTCGLLIKFLPFLFLFYDLGEHLPIEAFHSLMVCTIHSDFF